MVTSPRLSKFPSAAAGLPLLHGKRPAGSPPDTLRNARHELDDPEASTETGPPSSRTLTLHPSFYILSWIFFSNCTILFNKWLLDHAGFRYPILLTCWHLVFATLATQILAHTTSLLDSRHTLPVDGRLYLYKILPIGLLYSGSLVCSNVVYLYLSVPFIQMLKSAAPVIVLLLSWVWGLASPDVTSLVNIVVIVAGVAMASAGEIHFSWVGFFCQIGGIVFEAMRLIMIQVMLSSEGLKMDPLVGLYYYAPVCAAMNFIVALVGEVPTFDMRHLWTAGPLTLLLNALVAFLLNVASVCLIGRTSGLVMALTGILKSILLVITSVLIWGTPISPLQSLGYSTALTGLACYSLDYDQFSELFHSTLAWVSEALGVSHRAAAKGGMLGYSAWTPERRRAIAATSILCLISIFVVVGLWHGPAALRRAQDVFPGLLGPERL